MKLLILCSLLTLSLHTVAETAEVLEKHLAITGDECNSDYAPETYDLGNGAKLVLVPCYLGAYQGSTNAYIVSEFGDIKPVIVLDFHESIGGITASMDLIEASYDADTKTLTTRSRARGLGDCGQASISRVIPDEYGHAYVKTVEIRSKTECDGEYDEWPVIFEQ